MNVKFDFLNAYQVIEDVQELFIRLEEAKYARIMRKIQQLEIDVGSPSESKVTEDSSFYKTSKNSNSEVKFDKKQAQEILRKHYGCTNGEPVIISETGGSEISKRKMSVINEAYANPALDRCESSSALSSYKSIFPESNYKPPSSKVRKSRGQNRLQSLQILLITIRFSLNQVQV